MHIDSYSFGKMVIDGKTYTTDVIIYPDRVDASWWRKEGHYLQKTDLAGIVGNGPEVLVIGTGNMGVMHVPEDTISFLQSKGIEVRVEKSGNAVKVFNELSGKRKVVGAFHLTC